MEISELPAVNPGGFALLSTRQPLNVAPFPVRCPVWREVVYNADVRSEMDYADDDQRRGDMAEDLFVRLVRENGLEVEYSTPSQDYESHIDFIMIWPNGERKTVDVKGRKKIKRSDSKCAFETKGGKEELVWLELHGAYKTSRGWLQDGKADLIAFETETSFVFFHRQALADSVFGKDSFIDFNARVDSPSKAVNKVYPRGEVLHNGKFDEATLVSLERLQTSFPRTVFCVWNKKE